MARRVTTWRSPLLAGVVGSGLALAWFADAAYAQGHAHGGGGSLSRTEILAGAAHGAALGATVFLAGLVAFAALVWLPVGRALGDERNAARLFVRLAWVLFGLLVVAGLVEVSIYTVRASGQALSPGRLWVVLTESRTGAVWAWRLALAFVTVLVVAWAARASRPSYWWVATGLGGALSMTLTQLSHAATTSRPLPFIADWFHVMAASVWMGGLLGFTSLLLGPLRVVPAETRTELLRKAVSRFSRVAMVAVAVILLTGAYASLLYITSVSDLITTAYGRALIMKLGLVAFMLPIGAINMVDRGERPFDRMVGAELLLAFGVFVATGFLTSLPPP